MRARSLAAHSAPLARLRRLGPDADGNPLALLGPDTALGPPVSFASDRIQLASWLTLGEMDPATTSGNDCWGYVSGSGREYAIVCTSHGTAFIEVTQADDPQIVSVQPGPVSFWRDVKTYQGHAYVVSEGGDGIQVIDLSQIDSGQAALVNTVTTGGTPATHTSWINEDTGYLYRAGGDNHGLRIYDLSTPSNPVHVATWDDRYAPPATPLGEKK